MNAAASQPIVIRPFARRDYDASLQEMRAFTTARTADTPDEIWLVEHEPVFTQGLAGRATHLHAPGAIPVVQTERGGQVTYHGPGQVLGYVLIDLHRRGLSVRDLVCRLEQALIDCLARYGVAGIRRAGAPGVYVAAPQPLAGSKIGALGLKVSRGRSWHGVALNVAMDLSPFARIDPCGFPGLAVSDIRSVLAHAPATDGHALPRAAACTGSPGCENAASIDPGAVAGTLGNCLARALQSSARPTLEIRPQCP